MDIAVRVEPGALDVAADSSLVLDPAGLLRHRGRLLVVADGSGGAEAAHTASTLVVQTVRDAYYGARGEEPGGDLEAALQAANALLHEARGEEPELGQMAAACTALVLHDGHCYVAHVGDCRGYLLRAGELYRLTEDHTLVAQQLRDAEITSEEAAQRPDLDVLLRSLGPEERAHVDVMGWSPVTQTRLGVRAGQPIPMLEGDVLVICSDGCASAGVAEATILEVASARAPEEAADRLAELVRESGAPDNATIQIARVSQREPAAPPVAAPSDTGAWPARLLYGALGLVLGAAIATTAVLAASGGSEASDRRVEEPTPRQLLDGAPVATTPDAAGADATVEGPPARPLLADVGPPPGSESPPVPAPEYAGPFPLEDAWAAAAVDFIRKHPGTLCDRLLQVTALYLELGSGFVHDDPEHLTALVQAVADFQQRFFVDGMPGPRTLEKLLGGASEAKAHCQPGVAAPMPLPLPDGPLPAVGEGDLGHLERAQVNRAVSYIAGHGDAVCPPLLHAIATRLHLKLDPQRPITAPKPLEQVIRGIAAFQARAFVDGKPGPDTLKMLLKHPEMHEALCIGRGPAPSAPPADFQPPDEGADAAP